MIAKLPTNICVFTDSDISRKSSEDTGMSCYFSDDTGMIAKLPTNICIFTYSDISWQSSQDTGMRCHFSDDTNIGHIQI